MKDLKSALGVRNNGETAFSATCSHRECDKSFTSDVSQGKADLALRMHVGRTHARNIVPAAEGGVQLTRSARNSRLTQEESGNLIDHIRQHKDQYPSKAAAVRAAVEACGLGDRLKVSSTTCDRYYRKASESNGEVKRKYIRRQQPKPFEHHVAINFCPQCGCNIHAIATGMAVAALG